MRRFWINVFEIAGPVLALAALAAAWALAETHFGAPRYMLPTPGEVGAAAQANAIEILTNTYSTFIIIVLGFAISVAVGVPLAFVIVSFRKVELAVYPVIVALQFFPKTIIAPLLVVWFGIGVVPKSVLIMLMSFFPILIESMAGFRHVDPRLLYVTATMGATRRQDLFFVQLPSALPHIAAGMKTAMIYAVTAAIVAEYVGSKEGVGYLILVASGNFNLPMAFAAIIAASLLGVLLSVAMLAAERLMMPWLAAGR